MSSVGLPIVPQSENEPSIVIDVEPRNASVSRWDPASTKPAANVTATSASVMRTIRRRRILVNADPSGSEQCQLGKSIEFDFNFDIREQL